ncbi:putative membrane protein [Xenorhabdus bovienii str. oregonense]|uniref:Cell division protein DamX n=1 Tax=Xenorhabdus bovienii str. oregonense TaxID=1398202 RepID=A0A077P3H1_XENBV|nr:SPOR domain-containing protein [Xenorhabdus bovienii]CDH05344.1 putative membrane protein [Xenorhabdus bovienii str. oregonense]
MDELKSENKQKTENEFKPDTSDRHPPRSRSQSNQPKLAVPRQQLMIGVGILVLLLLIIAISSALKSPTEHEKQQSQNTAEKNIDLSGSSSLSTNNQNSSPENPLASAIHGSQEISMPPISNTPSKDLSPAPEASNHNQRIELPGDISDALNQQQGNINNTVQKNLTPSQSNPMQKTVIPPVEQNKTEKVAPPKIEKTEKVAKSEKHAKSTDKPAITHHQASKKSVTDTRGDLLKASANRFTLQLSSASRSDTLIAFAKNNNLSNYTVYEAKREGKAWFILIHGSYGSVSDAKSAISSLPAEVQAKKPWVRKLQQVQQDLKK